MFVHPLSHFSSIRAGDPAFPALISSRESALKVASVELRQQPKAHVFPVPFFCFVFYEF